MGEMLVSKTEFTEKPKNPKPAKVKKSDVTQLVEGEIARDQERWRVAVIDAVSSKSVPPGASRLLAVPDSLLGDATAALEKLKAEETAVARQLAELPASSDK